jgi:hypothetical protein
MPANRRFQRVDRTLAFQELCGDTAGLDNGRTMSDADGGWTSNEAAIWCSQSPPASSVSRLPGRFRYDGPRRAILGPHGRRRFAPLVP